MIELLIDNVYIKILNASKECESTIWEKLSFKIEDYNNPYPKIRHLFNRKTKLTYTGLYEYIIDILDIRGEEYKIVDNRVQWQQNANFKIVDYLDNNIKLETRPYQQKVVDNCKNRTVIMAATGAGKTFIMAKLIEKFNVKPIAVFADKISLCNQLRNEFSKFLNIDIGLVGGGVYDKKDITIYSMQSAQEKDIKDAKMIMFDECLTGDTLITMWNKQKFTIKDIVEKHIQQAVLSYNINTKVFEPKYITNYSKIPLSSKNKKLVRLIIKGEDNIKYIIKCTEDHKIWIESEHKYIEAGKLKKDMEVVIHK